MARLSIEDAAGLAVRDVVHSRFSALPANSTVREVRAWFAESSHRRLAVLADQGRYVGSLTRAALADETDLERAAAELSRPGPVIAPEEPASAGSQLALSTEALRLPVVDHDGSLVGVIGMTDDLEAFCGAA